MAPDDGRQLRHGILSPISDFRGIAGSARRSGGVHPARWKALQKGIIDAAFQPVPLHSVAVDVGDRNLGEVTDYSPEIVFTALIADRVGAAARRLLIVAFRKSLLEATRWVYCTVDDAELAIDSPTVRIGRDRASGSFLTCHTQRAEYVTAIANPIDRPCKLSETILIF